MLIAGHVNWASLRGNNRLVVQKTDYSPFDQLIWNCTIILFFIYAHVYFRSVCLLLDTSALHLAAVDDVMQVTSRPPSWLTAGTSGGDMRMTWQLTRRLVDDAAHSVGASENHIGRLTGKLT